MALMVTEVLRKRSETTMVTPEPKNKRTQTNQTQLQQRPQQPKLRSVILYNKSQFKRTCPYPNFRATKMKDRPEAQIRPVPTADQIKRPEIILTMSYEQIH